MELRSDDDFGFMVFLGLESGRIRVSITKVSGDTGDSAIQVLVQRGTMDLAFGYHPILMVVNLGTDSRFCHVTETGDTPLDAGVW